MQFRKIIVLFCLVSWTGNAAVPRSWCGTLLGVAGEAASGPVGKLPSFRIAESIPIAWTSMHKPTMEIPPFLIEREAKDRLWEYADSIPTSQFAVIENRDYLVFSRTPSKSPYVSYVLMVRGRVFLLEPKPVSGDAMTFEATEYSRIGNEDPISTAPLHFEPLWRSTGSGVMGLAASMVFRPKYVSYRFQTTEDGAEALAQRLSLEGSLISLSQADFEGVSGVSTQPLVGAIDRLTGPGIIAGVASWVAIVAAMVQR